MLYTSNSLPLSKIQLDDWQLIKVSGADNHKFFQGQVTNNLDLLNDTHFLFTAQCDPKGKVWSNMLLFKRGDDIYYIERKSVVEAQLKELKKYAIFSKVSFVIETDLTMIGIAGQTVQTVLSSIESCFGDEQNCLTQGNITYLKIDFPTTRYIIIGQPNELAALPFATEQSATSQQWSLLDLEANYPIIDLPVSNQYLPQAFNLQNFNAISFDKGCYCGQEMVARAQFRGMNKRALYLLTGHSDSLPQIGDTLLQQIDDNWRETGCVLAMLQLDDHTIWVQAVLNNDLDANTVFSLKTDSDSRLRIK